MEPPILVVTGLKREAALLRGPGVVPVVGGGDSMALAARLDAAILQHRPRGVISVGLGGALSPALRVGDWVVAQAVVGGGARWVTDAGWSHELQQRLVAIFSSPAQRGRGSGDAGGGDSPRGQAGAPPPSAPPPPPPLCRGGELGTIAASDVIVADVAAKAALHAATGALAVDMESHVAARAAAAHGLPFAALRVISDSSSQALPGAAQAGMKANGGIDLAAVLTSLARHPRQLPALIRTGREAEVAFRRLALLRRHDLLGRLGVGDADFGQLAVDVV